MEITNGILKWLETFPKIAEIGELHSETLSENVKNIALQRTGKETISKYLVGGKFQLQFMLWLKNYSEDDINRIESLGLLDLFSEWASEQIINNNIPQIGEDKTVYSIETSNILLMNESEDGIIGDYGIQLYINYIQK